MTLKLILVVNAKEFLFIDYKSQHFLFIYLFILKKNYVYVCIYVCIYWL